MIENLESVLEERRESKLLNKMTNQIKIFNSEKEAKGLEGTLIDSVNIRDGNDPFENISYAFQGKFTAMQRLKQVAKDEAKELKADYGIIADKYETCGNLSGHLQNMEDCDVFQNIKVNFYKIN